MLTAARQTSAPQRLPRAGLPGEPEPRAAFHGSRHSTAAAPPRLSTGRPAARSRACVFSDRRQERPRECEGTLRWCRSRLRGVWNLIEEADIESQYKQKLIMQQSAPVSKGSGRPALLTASDARPARESSPARLVRPLAPRMASVSSEVPPVARPCHAARDGRRLNVCPAMTCAPGLG